MTTATLSDALKDAEVFTDGDWVESKDQDPDGDVRLVQLADIGLGSFVDKSSRFMTSAKASDLRCTYLEPGDVLVARMPDPIGRACIFPGDTKSCVTVVDVCIVRPNPATVDCRWLMHWFNSPNARGPINRAATGTTRKRISRGNLGRLDIDLPPIEEQRRIAAVLDAADELRAIRRQAIAKLDTLTQAIFIDMFGDPAQNVHKWEECKLEDVALQVTDGEHATPPRTTAGVKLLSARNVRDGFLALEDVDYVSIETYNNLKQRCDPSAGDVLISCSGTIGRVTALDGTEPFALVRSVALVRPDADLIHPLYLEAYLQTVSMNRLMKQRANASSQANLFQNQVRSLPLFLPPQDLQRRFTSVISETRPNDDALSRSQCGLDTLFASLQQRAFRGEL